MIDPIFENRVTVAEAERTCFVARPNAGVTFEQCLEPTYFGNAVERFQVGSRIELIPLDVAWWGEVVVMRTDVTRRLVFVQAIGTAVKPSKFEKADLGKGTTVEQISGKNEWRVLRDRRVLKSGFTSENDAQQWAAGGIV